MNNIINKIKKNSTFGYVGIETAIVSALIVAFALATYTYLNPSFKDIAVSIKNSVTGTY